MPRDGRGSSQHDDTKKGKKKKMFVGVLVVERVVVLIFVCILREKAGKRLRVVKNFSILSKTVLFSTQQQTQTTLARGKREREGEKKKKSPRGGHIIGGGSSDYGRPGRLGHRRKR